MHSTEISVVKKVTVIKFVTSSYLNNSKKYSNKWTKSIIAFAFKKCARNGSDDKKLSFVENRR